MKKVLFRLLIEADHQNEYLTKIINPLLVLSSPTLSIIMPVFNAAPYIGEAVKSLLCQHYEDFELIVVDDGSTDNSLDILKDYTDKRIRIIRNSENKGIVFSRNRGLKMARGFYIAPFDADDIALPEKFKKQISFLEGNHDFGMVGSWVRLIDENSKLLPQKWKLNAPPEQIPSIMLFRNYFVQSAVVLRRGAIPNGGYAAGYDIVEDYRMWVDVARKYKTWNYPEYLLHYRIHPKSITQENKSRLEQRDKMIFKYLLDMLGIIPEEKDLELLISLKSSHPIKNKHFFKDLERLLYKLMEQNKKLRVYDQKELVKAIYNRWIKISVRSRNHLISAIKANIKTGLHWHYLKESL